MATQQEEICNLIKELQKSYRRIEELQLEIKHLRELLKTLKG